MMANVLVYGSITISISDSIIFYTVNCLSDLMKYFVNIVPLYDIGTSFYMKVLVTSFYLTVLTDIILPCRVYVRHITIIHES